MVETLWDNGWQPADVGRIVSRRAGAREVRMCVDAIAGQMRRYAAATVDERWEAQLTVLDAAVWWAGDAEWLDAWGEREGQDRRAVLVCAITLLGVLSALPALPVLCPPPGSARRDTRSPRQSAAVRGTHG